MKSQGKKTCYTCTWNTPCLPAWPNIEDLINLRQVPVLSLLSLQYKKRAIQKLIFNFPNTFYYYYYYICPFYLYFQKAHGTFYQHNSNKNVPPKLLVSIEMFILWPIYLQHTIYALFMNPWVVVVVRVPKKLRYKLITIQAFIRSRDLSIDMKKHTFSNDAKKMTINLERNYTWKANFMET